MSREEYLKYVLEQYKEIFGENFDEKRAMESAESLLNASNGDVENAKVAADAVINRTRAKMEASKVEKEFDKMPAWVGVLYEKDVVIDDEGKVKVDGKEEMTIDINKPFAEILKELREALKPKEEEKEFDEYSEQMLFDDLAVMKEFLFDAPAEVKAAYNQVVEYFAFGGVKNMFKGMKDNYKMGKLREKISKIDEKIKGLQEEKKAAIEELKSLKEDKTTKKN